MKTLRFSPWNILWLVLAALYFLVPLVGSAEFSLETGPGKYGFDAYRVILQDPAFKNGFLLSFFLTITLVMGEFTISSLLLFNTFAVYVEYTGETKANPAAALAMISFALTWAAMLGVLWLGRGVGRRQVQIGGTR